MNYLALLEHSFTYGKEVDAMMPATRLAFVSDFIFDFTTYDEGMSDMMAVLALETCAAITEGKTFEYIEVESQYIQFIMMCNMPFIAQRIDWGTSIRGAWWTHDVTDLAFYPSGLYAAEQDNEPINELCFPKREDWIDFMRALQAFCASEIKERQGG